MKSMLIGIIFACLRLFAAIIAAPAAEQQQQALPACADQQLVITGDSKIEVYVDGVRASLANADNWRVADTVKVAASAKVIAVKAEDNSFVTGILASGANFVTDRSWKCTATFSPGWETASFDDSSWDEATHLGKHGKRPWEKITGIDIDAFWIWTNKSFSDNVVFCRKTLPPCDPCPGAGTGPVCVTSCEGRKDGDYQSCRGCNVYATCANGILYDERQCTPSAPGAPPLVWDDTLKRCEYNSETCKTCGSNINKSSVVGTGPACITSCAGRLDGDYQSCKGCKVYASCSSGSLSDERPCAPSNPPLVWDDKEKRCERESTTCTECS